MSRAMVILNSRHERERVASWAQQAAPGTIVEFRQSKRTLDQNARLWACLTEIARKVEWHGEKLPADDWKDIFTAALRKHRFVPGIDAGTVVPLGMRTSDMTKQEFGGLLELINAFAAERGIEFTDTPSDAPMSEGSDGDPQGTPPAQAVAAEPLHQESGEQEEEAPDATGPEPAHGEQAASSSDLTPEDRDWLKQTARMLWAATGVGEQDVLKNQMTGIRDNLTPATISKAARDKANSINSRCKLVCFGEASAADTLALIAGIAGCEPKEIA